MLTWFVHWYEVLSNVYLSLQDKLSLMVLMGMLTVLMAMLMVLTGMPTV